MAEDQGVSKDVPELRGDEIVISGMSGTFPSSQNMLELYENLYNKVDMVTVNETQTNIMHPDLPRHLGKIKNLDKFDAQFFRVTPWQASSYDLMGRQILEHAFAAIFDSGTNPAALYGTRLGVFIGSTSLDASTQSLYDILRKNIFIMTGTGKAMFANRISYWINSKGPSYTIDVSCASAMASLEHAYNKIQSGECDAAIVGGCNHCMHPVLTLNFQKYGLLCLDGKTKCFDKNGDGYVRSDGISILLLQKAKDAKRIYAEVVKVKGKYFTSPNSGYGLERNPNDIQKFLEEFYSEINISPKDVEYIEANATGIAAADGDELKAIGDFFAKDKPIKVGSIKSNMGNTEAASAACALTKVCLAYHKGLIAANLHYNEPQDHISAVRDGNIQVVTKHVPFNRGFTAINNFSLSGLNYHVLLKGHYKQKKIEDYKTSLPYLIPVSGRQEKCVNKIFDLLENGPIDPEQIALLHNIFNHNISGHTGRGYIILDSNENNKTTTIARSFQYYTGKTRPVWFLYSGMGSQWAGMGAELMRIPIFAKSIERCHKAMEPKGLDVTKLVTEADETEFHDILNSMVGIAAIQIGLTDTLKAMGIVPDYIIGHSVGELSCAYADGCITVEETMLSCFSRGQISIQTKSPHGSMFAVGLGYTALLGTCPPEIDIACRNSSESTTISGPTDIVNEFVAKLIERGIFTKKVPTSNIAFHSRYIVDAALNLKFSLEKIIKDPKLRSKKWISTSVPREKRDCPSAKYFSAEYFTNNLVSPVYFEEGAKVIQDDAIVIEIAPRGLMQAILKRSHKNCMHISLTNRGNSNGVNFLLQGIGKLYQAGMNPKVDVLYPKVKFPVSTPTPILSNFVGWDHSTSWYEEKYKTQKRKRTSAREYVMSIHDDDYNYIEGHIRNGVNVFPESALLVIVWETLAMYKGVDYRNLSVTFEYVKFHGEVIIKPEEALRLRISIQKGCNRFEVTHERTQIATGFINDKTDLFREQLTPDDENILNANDIYMLLHMRGYSYEGEFRSIHSSNISRNKGSIKWNGTWVTFLDSLIQINAFARDHDGVSTPKLINKINIDVNEHKKSKYLMENNIMYYDAELFEEIYGVTKCGGVEIEAIVFNDEPKLEETPETLLTQTFFPYFPTKNINLHSALAINLQIVSENLAIDEIKVVELNAGKSTHLDNDINEIIKKIQPFGIEVYSTVVRTENNILLRQHKDIQSCNLLIVYDFLDNQKKLKMLHDNLQRDTFVLAVEKKIEQNNLDKLHNFDIITNMDIGQYKFILIKKTANVDLDNATIISKVKSKLPVLQNNNHTIFLLEKHSNFHLEGLSRKLRKENNKLYIVNIRDNDAPLFTLQNSFYKAQLKKNLAVNVLKQSQWGGYYYVPAIPLPKIENVKLISGVAGGLENLTWIKVLSPSENDKFVKVCYADLSLKDYHRAISKDTENNSFGMGFSGIDNKGKQVMGLISRGAVASMVEADSDLLWQVPEHWSLEDAATVPLPYVHAYYCLALKGKLLRRQTIFVAGGAGALGQAIISLSLKLDCTVYTAVSNIEKKRFLMKTFPQLDDNNILDSNDVDFCSKIINKTKNKGCDLVINCYNGPLREAAMKCVGSFNFFLDISEYDFKENKSFGMFYLEDDRTYKAVQVSSIFLPEHPEEKKILQGFISEGIAKGIVRPVSRVTYPPTEISRAFKMLSSNRRKGKVLVNMKDTSELRLNLKIFPSITWSSDGVYIIVCDGNKLEIELVDRLVRKGVRKLVLNFRPTYMKSYFLVKFAFWQKHDVTIEINTDDLQIKKGCENLLEVAAKLGPLHGIFVIQNYIEKPSIIEGKIIDDLKRNTSIIRNLDLISRKDYKSLRHFMVIALTSHMICNDQECAECEVICEKRNESGLPTLILKYVITDEANVPWKIKLQNVSALFTAMESSLIMHYGNILLMHSKESKQPDLLQSIAKMLSVKDSSLTLGELDINLEEIRNVLAKNFKINYSIDELRCMTLSSLTRIENTLKMQKTRYNCGLHAFINYVDKNEIQASEPIITMTKETEIELDPTEAYLVMIPGFDGHYQTLASISDRVKIPAVALQLIPDFFEESMSAMAQNLMNYIKKSFKLKSKFYFLGYSFGVNIALELAALMEKEGHIGIVYCLDSSPTALQVQLNAYLGNLSESTLQNNLIKHIYNIIIGKDSHDLENDLQIIEDWSEKIEAFINRVKGSVAYSHEYLKSYLQATYRRMILAREYEPNFKLQSQLVLLKGIPHPKAEKLLDDYGLSKYTIQPVKVFEIASDHVLAPEDCRVSNIVNKLLDPKLLEDFETKNLCDFYHSSK